MVVSEISLYNALREMLGEQKAQTVVEGIKEEVRSEFENRKEMFSTKEDIAKLDSRISQLETKIAESKSEILRWTFIFWVGSVGVLSGILFAMLNAYLK